VGGDEVRSQTVRVGALSALLQDLVHPDVPEPASTWEEALVAGYRGAADLRNSRWYEPLRKDPRFEKLLAKYGLGP
jgi:hypothetical protein